MISSYIQPPPKPPGLGLVIHGWLHAGRFFGRSGPSDLTYPDYSKRCGGFVTFPALPSQTTSENTYHRMNSLFAIWNDPLAAKYKQSALKGTGASKTIQKSLLNSSLARSSPGLSQATWNIAAFETPCSTEASAPPDPPHHLILRTIGSS